MAPFPAFFRGGASFDSVIGSSAPPYAFAGGDLGWRKLDDLPSLLTDVAPQLRPGETSDPIRSDSGLHLVHMADVRGGEQVVAVVEDHCYHFTPSRHLHT